MMNEDQWDPLGRQKARDPLGRQKAILDRPASVPTGMSPLHLPAYAREVEL